MCSQMNSTFISLVIWMEWWWVVISKSWSYQNSINAVSNRSIMKAEWRRINIPGAKWIWLAFHMKYWGNVGLGKGLSSLLGHHGDISHTADSLPGGACFWNNFLRFSPLSRIARFLQFFWRWCHWTGTISLIPTPLLMVLNEILNPWILKT